MSRVLILTFIADDRPGLVEKLAGAVTAHDGNWLESRMAHLAEKFAGIARVEAEPDSIAAIRHDLEALRDEGIAVTVEEAAAGGAVAPGLVATLDLVGPDHPGIVQEIAGCLAIRGVTIEEMETRVEAAPMGGGDLFNALLHIRAPADLDEDGLRSDLERLSTLLMVDITLKEETVHAQPG